MDEPNASYLHAASSGSGYPNLATTNIDADG